MLSPLLMMGKRVRGLLALGAGLLAIFILHLMSLWRHPPYVDEAFYISLAMGYLRTGYPFGPLQAGILETYEGAWTFFPWLITWLHAIPLALFGYDLVPVRFISFAAGIVVALSVFIIGRELDNRTAALVATVLTTLSSSFSFSASIVRPDILVAAAGYGAVALFLVGHRQHRGWTCLMAGVMIAASLEIHPNSMIFTPIIIALYYIYYGPRMIVHWQIWAFIGVNLLGGISFYVIHILQYQETAKLMLQVVFGESKQIPLLAPATLLDSLINTLILLLKVHMTVGFAAPVIPIFCLILRDRLFYRAMIPFLVLFVEFIAIVTYKPDAYGILLVPAANIAVAALLVRIPALRWNYRSKGAHFIKIFVYPLVLLPILWSLFWLIPIRENIMNRYQRNASVIRSYIPEGSMIMGDERYWISLSDYEFVGWSQALFYRQHAKIHGHDASISTAMLAHQPDYLIVDKHMEWFWNHDIEYWATKYWIDYRVFAVFLQEHTELVAEFPSGILDYGTIRLYRVVSKP
jgi:4-amino-4-deoxy-L-arabinose transferase-like glycosyltransferase